MNTVDTGSVGSRSVSRLLISVVLGVCSIANAEAASNGIIPYSLKAMKRDYAGMINRGELVEIKENSSKAALLVNKCIRRNYFAVNR